MNINRLVEDVLSNAAVELLDTLAAHAVVTSPDDKSALYFLPVEPESWNATVLLMREIFDAEVTVSDASEWLSFRILQSFGVRNGQLAYQFTPTFAKALG